MKNVAVAIKLAWRETRGSWRQFLFFFVCIAIGVGAVVGVGLFAANVEQVILGDARGLLGGDLEIRLSRLLSESGHSVLESLRNRNIALTHVSELVAMASTEGNSEAKNPRPGSTQLVELKVVEEGYPLYGRVEVQPPKALSSHLTFPQSRCEPSPCFGAVVQKSFLISLDVDLGSHIKIGQARFIITGVLLKEPDRVASAFSLGPRVIISRQALVATELVKPGSRIRERYLLRVPESMSLGPLKGELRGRLAKEGARVSSYRDAQPRIRRFLDQLSTYLGLIGLTALFVGGIGVACTVQGFIKQKLTTIAILKTLGAGAGLIVGMYLLQSLLMGAIGSLVGAGFGISLQIVLPVLLQGLLPLPLTPQLFLHPLLKGVALGIGTTALFTLWPLLTIRTIPPALVFRRDVEQAPLGHPPRSLFRRLKTDLSRLLRDSRRVGTGLVMGGGLAGLAMWQARSITLGLLFMAAFLTALILLRVAAKLLLHLLTKASRPRSFVVRQAIGNVQHPGNFTAGMAVSIGVGVMVIVAIALIKTSLLLAIGERIPEDAPAFFFIDIQPDQKVDFERVVQEETRSPTYTLTPVVRSRLASLNGQPIDPEEHKGKRNGWYFTREYVLTALPDLPKDNTIVKGHWWTEEPKSGQTLQEEASAPILVSVEAEAARNLGLDIGSTLEFDIQGATMAATVESTRHVDWGSFSTNFFMILSPDSLQGAPFTYIATANVDPEEEVPLQRALVKILPNVTAIKVGDILENVARLLRQLSWAIQGIALLCIAGGAVVMTTALSTTRYRRLYEASILKALGGTRRIIVKAFALEFAMVGTLAGVIGVGLASALSWAILYFFLDLPWAFQPGVLGWGLVLTVLLAITVGFLSTFRILGEPPLAVLRQE